MTKILRAPFRPTYDEEGNPLSPTSSPPSSRRVPQSTAFHLEDSTDPDYFIPPPSGGVPVAGRVDPEIKAMIQDLVQSGKTPFKKEGDLVRSAVFWFLTQRMDKIQKGYVNDGMRILQARVRNAQSLARAYDLKAFKDSNVDAILKVWLVSPNIAAEYYQSMGEVAEAVDENFAHEVRVWANSDPRFDRVREYIAEMKRASRAEEEREEARLENRGKGKKEKKPKRSRR